MDQPLLRFFWSLLAFTVPFFAVAFNRFNLGNLHAPPPVLLLIAIFYIAFLTFCLAGKIPLPPNHKSYKTLGIITYLLITYHLFTLLYTPDMHQGIKELLKLTTGILIFWGVIFLFPRDQHFLKKFIFIFSWVNCFLLLLLIYKYAFVFKVPFLGNNLSTYTRSGKNQLAWYVSVTLSYVLFYFWQSKLKILSLVPLAVCLFSLIYIGSRGAWISFCVGLIYSLILIIKMDVKTGLKMIAKIFSFGLALVMILIIITSSHINYFELAMRAATLVGQAEEASSLPDLGTGSVDNRSKLIREGMEVFKSSPVFGVGVGKLFNNSHNDYVRILGELGIIGFSLFLIFLVCLLIKTLKTNKDIPLKKQWTSIAGRASLVSCLAYFMFMNVYTGINLWFILAFSLVCIEVVGQQRVESR